MLEPSEVSATVCSAKRFFFLRAVPDAGPHRRAAAAHADAARGSLSLDVVLIVQMFKSGGALIARQMLTCVVACDIGDPHRL